MKPFTYSNPQSGLTVLTGALKRLPTVAAATLSALFTLAGCASVPAPVAQVVPPLPAPPPHRIVLKKVNSAIPSDRVPLTVDLAVSDATFALSTMAPEDLAAAASQLKSFTAEALYPESAATLGSLQIEIGLLTNGKELIQLGLNNLKAAGAGIHEAFSPREALVAYLGGIRLGKQPSFLNSTPLVQAIGADGSQPEAVDYVRLTSGDVKSDIEANLQIAAWRFLTGYAATGQADDACRAFLDQVALIQLGGGEVQEISQLKHGLQGDLFVALIDLVAPPPAHSQS